MPAIYTPSALRTLFERRAEQRRPRPWLRSLILLLLFLLSLAFYWLLITSAPPNPVRIDPFVQTWMFCFLTYFVACGYILATRPLEGRWLWVELSILFGAALVFRLILLPLPPELSRDSWRYLWDARVTLHGYSPYVYPPDASVFTALRDQLYSNMRFRTVPTLYPPGAQAVYLVSYLLAPGNLYLLKGIFIGFDMLTCVALMLVLKKRGLDPRRVVIYAWCPLPIVEFAIQGHVDVITVPFLLLSVLCALSTHRGARVLTGFLIGIATLTKIYPIFLLVVVVKRRDWALVVTCLLTIVMGYLPYYILGHGQVFGYLSSYAGEQGGNAGVLQIIIYNFLSAQHATLQTIVTVEHVIDVLAVVLTSLVVFLLRRRKRISMEAASMVLIGVIFAISSHVFPWYITALLPWIAVLFGRTFYRGQVSGKSVAVATAWYFVCISPIGYFYTYSHNWQHYYTTVYVVVVAFLALAAFVGIRQLVARRRTVTN